MAESIMAYSVSKVDQEAIASTLMRKPRAGKLDLLVPQTHQAFSPLHMTHTIHHPYFSVSRILPFLHGMVQILSALQGFLTFQAYMHHFCPENLSSIFRRWSSYQLLITPSQMLQVKVWFRLQTPRGHELSLDVFMSSIALAQCHTTRPF